MLRVATETGDCSEVGVDRPTLTDEFGEEHAVRHAEEECGDSRVWWEHSFGGDS